MSAQQIPITELATTALAGSNEKAFFDALCVENVSEAAEAVRKTIKDKKNALNAVNLIDKLSSELASSDKKKHFALTSLTLEVFDDLLTVSHEAKFMKLITKSLKLVLQESKENRGYLRAFFAKSSPGH